MDDIKNIIARQNIIASCHELGAYTPRAVVTNPATEMQLEEIEARFKGIATQAKKFFKQK